ncbi:GM19594 [Drosophila sechellia]|uniref:GM19594 n=1 Tax=Drosophila sechellia TaxID=7238 RepID=B4IIM3_DROSE|nr:GM19594 [Drosophila sechellia]
MCVSRGEELWSRARRIIVGTCVTERSSSRPSEAEFESKPKPKTKPKLNPPPPPNASVFVFAFVTVLVTVLDCDYVFRRSSYSHLTNRNIENAMGVRVE